MLKNVVTRCLKLTIEGLCHLFVSVCQINAEENVLTFLHKLYKIRDQKVKAKLFDIHPFQYHLERSRCNP